MMIDTFLTVLSTIVVVGWLLGMGYMFLEFSKMTAIQRKFATIKLDSIGGVLFLFSVTYLIAKAIA